MSDRSASVTCILLGLMIGGLIGIGGFVLIPLLVDLPDPWLRWGVLFWYPTLGAALAGFGLAVRERFPGFAWWLAGLGVGVWMTLVLTFFAHAQMRLVIAAVFGSDAPFTSPFWFVIEGGAVGALMGLVIDRFAGEGRVAGAD